MKRREIIELLKSYKFDINEYIVLSGAAMVIHGLKDETNDIDISVTPEYYDYLLSHYDCEFEKINEFNHAVYYIDNVINFGRDYYDNERTIIDGISVQTIENIIRLKQYLNREKDKHDLNLLNLKHINCWILMVNNILVQLKVHWEGIKSSKYMVDWIAHLLSNG